MIACALGALGLTSGEAQKKCEEGAQQNRDDDQGELLDRLKV
jgi:hypothetical protein